MNTVLRATPDGTTLATERLPGDGPLVMVLHGFTGDRNSMRPFAHALTPAYEVLLVDLVGHGESDSPEHLEPYRMPSVVDQALCSGAFEGFKCNEETTHLWWLHGPTA